MSKLNSLFVATVRSFNGSTDNPATADKNGEMPVILNVVAGKCPNARVLSGTIAKSLDLQIGSSYLFNCTEGTPDPEYGRRFTFDACEKMDAMQIINASSTLGNAQLIDVTSDVEETEEANTPPA